MIQMLILRLLLVALVCIAALDVAERFDPGPPPLLIEGNR